MFGLRPLALGVLAALAVAAAAIAGDDDKRPDVRVALLSSGKCGKLADSLPALVTRSGLRPGDVVGDITVCVANGGGGGRLVLGVTDLVDTDPACTGAEAGQDTSCGGGQRGELSPTLVQRFGLGACPSAPSLTQLDRPLPDLGTRPLTLADKLRRGELVCVRLRLLYEPSESEAVVSQSDRTTWRYAFSLAASD